LALGFEDTDVRPPEDLAQIAPKAIIVMGVSGSGKSTLGPLLAATFHCRFIEGDAFHSPENVEKMRMGQPLQDEDRWSWLDRIGAELNGAVAAHGIAVAACSALKRRYRERLEQAIEAPVAFVFLDADQNELTRRMQNRPDHYMPASLLASQFQALEAPGPDEPALVLDAHQPPRELCDFTRAWLARGANITRASRQAHREET
jgi:gluconokinase